MAAHKHFSMSALSAIIAIRRYINDYPDVDVTSAAISVRRLDADMAANDFDSALEIHDVLPVEVAFGDPPKDLRATLGYLIAKHRPWWTTAVPYGRERLATIIDRDEAQCFRAAGLLDEPASDDVVAWWDELAQTVRAEIGNQLLLQGREAERLSLAHERERLASLAIAREPRWVSIEDNGAGYDILSYSLGPAEPINRLIEVKSSTRNPPRVILSRNEWEAASRYGEGYVFHLWRLPAKILIERTVSEISQHIPTDRGRGAWAKVEIPIPWPEI